MLKINETIYQNINIALLSTFVVGLFFSNAVLSISTLLFFAWVITNKFKEIYLKENLPLGFLLLFMVYLFGAFWKTNNILDSLQTIISKISLLGFAFIYSIKIISNQQKKILFNLILFFLIGISFYTIIQYFSDKNYWNNLYSKGQVLPTFMHHVKFSLLIVLSINILTYTNIINNKFKNIIILYFIIYLHILAVKSGLLILYISIIIYIIQKIYYKKYQYIIILLFPVIGYLFSTNLQNKINYLKYDIQQLHQENVLDYSDARRIVSFQIAWNIFKENKLLGVGLTNIKKETENKYNAIYKYFDASKMMYVHNSYLQILVSTGVVGFILFTFSIIIILKEYWINNKLLFILNSLFLMVCFWDALTEQLVGLSIFILIQILGKQENLKQ
ncbi:MAG TPA: O-antigen ligase family protein [Chitinophagales bacterium]|nr:O-antigen ligase family protein [Chitinophagales bacterium]HMV02340.1 O-antigen ligase family protein [Chitinophagales bacterium]HMW94298.1 O-antigen ligase family protein [Chitinophagales bacterium]HMY42459.1 O-antigen ligase family protein [Chitinophagales bacterium]HMZ68879.1 O-antigen ligase family protein [Chitinophagales bacterium]